MHATKIDLKLYCISFYIIQFPTKQNRLKLPIFDGNMICQLQNYGVCQIAFVYREYEKCSNRPQWRSNTGTNH